MRTYRVGKKPGIAPTIALYENGQVMLMRTCTSLRQANDLGRAWAVSDEPGTEDATDAVSSQAGLATFRRTA